jgi:hypothetical protein
MHLVDIDVVMNGANGFLLVRATDGLGPECHGN